MKRIIGLLFRSQIIIFVAILVAPILESRTLAYGADKRFVTVRFQAGPKIEAEVADTPEKRSLGLMFREHLDPDRGMIFVFPGADYHRFWMKNCLFEIDMIWLDEKKKIVYHEENLPPCKDDPCPSYGPPAKALYVIETIGGFFKKMGLKNGMRVEWDLD